MLKVLLLFTLGLSHALYSTQHLIKLGIHQGASMQLVGSQRPGTFISCLVQLCDKKYVEILTRTNGSTQKKSWLPTFVEPFYPEYIQV